MTGGGSREEDLITGGAGFIGSHLAEELLQKGNDIAVLDDLSTGSLENIFHLKNETKFRFVLGSVMDEEKVDEWSETVTRSTISRPSSASSWFSKTPSRPSSSTSKGRKTL